MNKTETSNESRIESMISSTPWELSFFKIKKPSVLRACMTTDMDDSTWVRFWSWCVLLCVASANTQSLFADDIEPGFVRIFNGEDLSGWVGDERFWRVENGAIVGQTTADNPTERNTFLVYHGDTVDDFELRFSYRVTGGNSGIQYRSELLEKWVVKGLQADFEDQIHQGKDQYSGMFFEENGRMFMGQRGDVVIVRTNPDNPRQPQLEKIATVGDPVALEKVIKRDDWNDYTIMAKGNIFIHIINGHVMSIGIDEDPLNFRKSGILAWQLHAGPPLTIEMKNIRIRNIK